MQIIVEVTKPTRIYIDGEYQSDICCVESSCGNDDIIMECGTDYVTMYVPDDKVSFVQTENGQKICVSGGVDIHAQNTAKIEWLKKYAQSENPVIKRKRIELESKIEDALRESIVVWEEEEYKDIARKIAEKLSE